MLARLKNQFASVPSILWLLVLICSALVWFAGKALHIDDTLFVRAAQQIQQHPADFYGFTLNWWGTTQPMAAATDNPPLASYYLALAATVGGWNEWALHTAMLVPALAAAWGVFALAKPYRAHPALAAAIAVLTPVFLISATTLMCDMMLVAFWVWAMVWFEKGLSERRPAKSLHDSNGPVPAAQEKQESRSGSAGVTASGADGGTKARDALALRYFFFSGLLATLAASSKFTGLALVPLLAAYGLCRLRRLSGWVLAPLLPLLFAAGYEWLNHRLYGQSALLGAASHAVHSQAASHPTWGRQIVGLSFVGGCFLPILFYAPWMWPRRRSLTLSGLLAAGAILPLLVKEFKPWLWQADGHLNWVLYLHSALFVASGSQILLMAGADFFETRDARSLVLLLWMLGLFLFATVIYMFPNGRILLPMMPAIGILASRRLEKKIELARLRALWKLLWPAVPALPLSLLLVHADCRLANTGRAAARELLARYLHPGRTLWFEGHWGFQYYMERGGARPLERGFGQPIPGDVVVVPSEAVNAFDFPAQLVRLVDTLEYAPTPHYSTMSSSAGAGFYAATAGPFPFSAGQVDPERYYVFEVTGTLAAAAAAPGGVQSAGAMAQQFALERKMDACASTLRQHPQDARVRLELAIYLNLLRRTGQAVEQYRMLLRQTPDSVRALDDLGWILATDREQRWRNGPEAVQLAERANELTAGNSPDVLTTLGAAYAEAGNFESAVEAAEKAIQLARKGGQPQVVSTNERLLRLYRASRPYHQ